MPRARLRIIDDITEPLVLVTCISPGEVFSLAML
jgi:hypothetical protein